ncbi:MAG TPA: hypothetical protein VK978_03495 [Candidatus Saccharimonadales bacterium]|nr:hypothetical protein [Candidatus Saccharimonadales bacterium]
MNNENIVLAAVAAGLIILMLFVAAILKRRTGPKLNHEYYQMRWKELQGLCSDKKTWPLAIIDADKLLDEALKKSHYKGKTMGERLVTAQRNLSNNDAVWYAHKLRNKIVHEQYVNLKESDVKSALIGFRQALKDLGALK